MNGGSAPVGEDDLEAFVDGRLPGARLALVEAALAADPALAARVAADRALRADLRERLDPVAAQPIPARLRVRPMLARRRARARTIGGAVAASLLLLAAGGGAGWEARGWDGPPTPGAPAAEAIAAHRVFVVETVHPVEVPAAQEAHLVQWLSRRVGHTLTIPDLSAEGFDLMGGRVIPEDGRTAAQFMYTDRGGRRLTLLVRKADGADTRFRFASSDGFEAFSWVDGGLGFALVAAVDRPMLLALARATYGQLDPGAPLPAGGP